jgi:hypothetical protein
MTPTEMYEAQITKCMDEIKQLREENARLRHELGDAITECSIEGCAAWIVPVDDKDSYAGWIWTTKPDAGWPLALCPEHGGERVRPGW